MMMTTMVAMKIATMMMRVMTMQAIIANVQGDDNDDDCDDDDYSDEDDDDIGDHNSDGDNEDQIFSDGGCIQSAV